MVSDPSCVRASLALVILAALLASGCASHGAHPSASGDRPAVFDIPRLETVGVDGHADDWGDRGFRVDAMVPSSGKLPSGTEFASACRLGWNEQGLLVLLTVTDSTPFEARNKDSLFREDCVELFLGKGVGSDDLYQVVISPGVDPVHAELRQMFCDFRKTASLKTIQVPVSAARTRRADGYIVEALLPWENLGIKPGDGAEAAFQIYVNDGALARSRSRLMWYPGEGAPFDSKAMYGLRLAATASAPVQAIAVGEYEFVHGTLVSVAAAAELAGKSVIVKEGPNTVAAGKLVSDGNRASVDLLFPMPPLSKTYGPLDVWVGNQPLTTLTLPDAVKERGRALRRAELSFRPPVFLGEDFPPCDFRDRALVESLIGPYTLNFSFYDAAYHPVVAADKPGRYGAVIEVKPKNGKAFKRYYTLFRQPKDGEWYYQRLGFSAELPGELGIDPVVVREQSRTTVSEYLKERLDRSLGSDEASAIMLAGLYETRPGTPAVRRNAASSMNDRWWFGLKQKRGEIDTRYLAFLPNGYEQDQYQRWPMILFLHGSGGSGDDLEQVRREGGLAKCVDELKDFPFIVISPQCPAGQWWSTAELNALLDEVSVKYRVDPDRIYLTGLSLGGFATWDLALEHPERFAAIAPVAGGGDPADVGRIKDLPVWVLHGAKDPIVPPERAQEMIDALKQVGGRVKYTFYPDAFHTTSVWHTAYTEPKLFQWFLQQRRGDPKQPPATMPIRATAD